MESSDSSEGKVVLGDFLAVSMVLGDFMVFVASVL